MNKVLVIVMMGFVCSMGVFAEWNDGSELVDMWKEYKNESGNYFARGVYVGYISGVIDSSELTNLVLKETDYVPNNLGYNIPGNVTLGQICAVVGKYLDSNPEKWNLPGHLLVINALREAFPAKNN